MDLTMSEQNPAIEAAFYDIYRSIDSAEFSYASDDLEEGELTAIRNRVQALQQLLEPQTGLQERLMKLAKIDALLDDVRDVIEELDD